MRDVSEGIGQRTSQTQRSSSERGKAPRVGKLAKTLRYIQGYPLGISAGQFVTVLKQHNGRFHVSCNDRAPIWADADALESLC